MINHKDNPVAWARMLFQLEDACDHLITLLSEMPEATAEEQYDEIDYRINLGHIYAHLNRAWNYRNITDDEIDFEKWGEYNQFPSDIKPIV